MELDFASIKALSSTTRLRILKELLEEESTPTDLSDRVGRSKSTVSSHLDVLSDAGLVEKDAEEGRRRVIYRPTSKAKVVLHGGERRVRFTVGSVVLSSLISVGSVYRYLERRGAEYAAQATALSGQEAAGGDMGTMAMDAANATARTTAEQGLGMVDYGLLALAGTGAALTVCSVVYLIVRLYMDGDRQDD